MNKMELRLPGAVYSAMFDSIPRFHRLCLIGETREHFVLEHSRELLLIVAAYRGRLGSGSHSGIGGVRV